MEGVPTSVLYSGKFRLERIRTSVLYSGKFRLEGIRTSVLYSGKFLLEIFKIFSLRTVKLYLCLINQVPCHEDVWGSGDMVPRILNLDTR
jgi:hypothetical protein